MVVGQTSLLTYRYRKFLVWELIIWHKEEASTARRTTTGPVETQRGGLDPRGSRLLFFMFMRATRTLQLHTCLGIDWGADIVRRPQEQESQNAKN